MPLPNADRAVVDLRMLEDYALNPSHRVGRHKVRTFRDVLGLTRDDAQWLRDRLHQAVRTEPAALISRNAFGQQHRIDFTVTFRGQTAIIRSGWIILSD